MIKQSQPMNSLCVAMPSSSFGRQSFPELLARQVEFFAAQPYVTRLLILDQDAESEPVAHSVRRADGKSRFIQVDSWLSGKAMTQVLEAADADGLLFIPDEADLHFEHGGIEKLMAAAETSGAGLVYSDSRRVRGGDVTEQPKINYQIGSIGETFNFGSVILLSRWAAEQALNRYGSIAQDIQWAGLYDLRLKVSVDFPIFHVAESLYTERITPPQPVEHKVRPFYLPDRRSRPYQSELEIVATDHLRRLGAFVESGNCPPPRSDEAFPVPVSIIIPTRNRENTIGSAIQSALDQSTSFAYNIIVVDDHSTDRTSEIVRQIASRHGNVIYMIPEREDLGIGGLWNEAIYSPACGRYAVQLDSDDVYAHERAVETLIAEFRHAGDAIDSQEAPRYAMVVGSHTLVDFDLKEMPPGINQRLELSLENGRNNLLCIEGPGAPRAFYVPVLRRFGFPNVSFGEDYAIALRIGREYDVGRVFESVYLARQWEGNTYRSLPLGSIKSMNVRDILPDGISQQEFINRLQPIVKLMMAATANRSNTYKDYLRSVEIQARRNLTRR